MRHMLRWLAAGLLAALPCAAQAGFHCRVFNVDIDGLGSTAAVRPGSTVTVTADYTIWNDDGCPACVCQIVVALDLDGSHPGVP